MDPIKRKKFTQHYRDKIERILKERRAAKINPRIRIKSITTCNQYSIHSLVILYYINISVVFRSNDNNPKTELELELESGLTIYIQKKDTNTGINVLLNIKNDNSNTDLSRYKSNGINNNNTVDDVVGENGYVITDKFLLEMQKLLPIMITKMKIIIMTTIIPLLTLIMMMYWKTNLIPVIKVIKKFKE